MADLNPPTADARLKMRERAIVVIILAAFLVVAQVSLRYALG
jgi:hypothetical protein